jgi:pyruvate,water dikinase
LDKYLVWFKEVGMHDVGQVGGKNASLGEMIRNLSEAGVKVPQGFATTARAYYDFIHENDLFDRIQSALKALNVDDVNALAATGARIRQWILDAPLPNSPWQYAPRPPPRICQPASFAGQQETYLNVRGIDQTLLSIKRSLRIALQRPRHRLPRAPGL